MNELKINRVYKHFKGDYYLVVDIAKCQLVSMGTEIFDNLK